MFKNQPAGLYVLALANTGERFGYYTMLAIFLFYLQAKFGFDSTWTGQIFSIFLALVYFMPLLGGWLADKWSFSKCVVSGIAVMFVGYALMSAPTPVRSDMSLMILFAALLFISVGTGLFKGNLQVMVGDLYNEARYSDRRDAAFSLFLYGHQPRLDVRSRCCHRSQELCAQPGRIPHQQSYGSYSEQLVYRHQRLHCRCLKMPTSSAQ